jgi:hypothetical protein
VFSERVNGALTAAGFARLDWRPGSTPRDT